MGKKNKDPYKNIIIVLVIAVILAVVSLVVILILKVKKIENNKATEYVAESVEDEFEDMEVEGQQDVEEEIDDNKEEEIEERKDSQANYEIIDSHIIYSENQEVGTNLYIAIKNTSKEPFLINEIECEFIARGETVDMVKENDLINDGLIFPGETMYYHIESHAAIDVKENEEITSGIVLDIQSYDDIKDKRVVYQPDSYKMKIVETDVSNIYKKVEKSKGVAEYTMEVKNKLDMKIDNAQGQYIIFHDEQLICVLDLRDTKTDIDVSESITLKATVPLELFEIINKENPEKPDIEARAYTVLK